MLANAGGDFLRQYVISPDRETEIIRVLHERSGAGTQGDSCIIHMKGS